MFVVLDELHCDLWCKMGIQRIYTMHFQECMTLLHMWIQSARSPQFILTMLCIISFVFVSCMGVFIVIFILSSTHVHQHFYNQKGIIMLHAQLVWNETEKVVCDKFRKSWYFTKKMQATTLIIRYFSFPQPPPSQRSWFLSTRFGYLFRCWCK